MPTDQNYYASQLPYHRDVVVPLANNQRFIFTIDGRLRAGGLRVDNRTAVGGATMATLLMDNGREYQLPQGVWSFNIPDVSSFTVVIPGTTDRSAFSVDVTEESVIEDVPRGFFASSESMAMRSINHANTVLGTDPLFFHDPSPFNGVKVIAVHCSLSAAISANGDSTHRLFWNLSAGDIGLDIATLEIILAINGVTRQSTNIVLPDFAPPDVSFPSRLLSEVTINGIGGAAALTVRAEARFRIIYQDTN